MTSPNSSSVLVHVEADGRGSVLVDGYDISHVVEGLQLAVKPGRPSQLILDVRVDRAVHSALGRHEVHLPEATHDALVALGWTPP